MWETLPAVIVGEEQWEFKSKEDAATQVQRSTTAAKRAFRLAFGPLFDHMRYRAEEISRKFQRNLEEQIFSG